MSVRILIGDCRERLRELPEGSVHCCVTSPPYFGLRSYLPDGHPDKAKEIGLEPTPEAFVAELVDVFRDVRRVLRDDGTVWLNLGDSYAGTGKSGGGKQGERWKAAGVDVVGPRGGKWCPPPAGLKPKDLIGIPWRVAFALQADGWWLRSDNIWAKPNGMPESTRDRPSVAHEHVFQLSKSEHYYFGYDDVRLPPVPESVGRLARAMRSSLDEGGFVISGGGYAPPGQPPHNGARRSDKQRGHGRRHAGFNERWDAMSRAEQQSQGCALRSVWWLAPANYTDAHYATMPEQLAALLILAGCPKGGTVLDPFFGAGTTGLVADRLGRDCIGIELNPESTGLAEKRLKQDAGMFANVGSTAE